MPTSFEEMRKRFGFHVFTEKQQERSDQLRENYIALGHLVENMPNSRALSLAMTKLEESAMWAQKAILDMKE